MLKRLILFIIIILLCNNGFVDGIKIQYYPHSPSGSNLSTGSSSSSRMEKPAEITSINITSVEIPK